MPPPIKSELHSQQNRGAFGIQVTSIGQNQDPHWHPLGEKILFTSSRRQTHRSAQVYEMQLSNHQERRITYQNGDCQEPQYSLADNTYFYYSSTTDEAKERPLLFQRANGKKGAEPSYEIYRSSLTGENIDRLTQRSGFDGYIEQGPEKKIFFSANDNGIWTVRELSARGALRILFNTGAKIPHVSYEKNSKKWAWILQDKVADKDEIFINKILSQAKAERLPIPAGHYSDLTWIDSKSLLLSSDWDKKGLYQIYVLDLEKKCLGKIFEAPFSTTQPALSPKQKQLLFVGTENEPQIFLKDIDLSLISCTRTLEATEK